VHAFFNSHGSKIAYGKDPSGRLLTQTDLYRLFDLVKVQALKVDDFLSMIPKNEFRIMIIMNRYIPGWASPKEISDVLNREEKSYELFAYFNRLERISDLNRLNKNSGAWFPESRYEKDFCRVLQSEPEVLAIIQDIIMVYKAMNS